MSWKKINGARYFYESTVVDGDRVEICWGKGPEAVAAAERVLQEQLATEADWALIRAWRERDSITDALVRDGERSLSQDIRLTLDRAGLHQHKGQWRKRRKQRRNDEAIEDLRTSIMSSIKQQVGKRPARQQPKVPLSDLEGSIRERSLDTLREIGYSDEKITDAKTEVSAKVSEIVKSFSSELSTSFERLLIEQIATAWVQWYVASLLLDSASFAARSWRQNQYLEQRYQRSQTRLTRVIDQLSRIRCVPRCYLVNGRRNP